MFNELFEYNAQSNMKVISTFKENADQASEKAISLLNHIINAHQIWLARIEGQKPTGVWDIRPMVELEVMDQSNHATTLKILETKNLKDVILYSNSSGHTFSNTVEDILFHIINHSTYHRGQIALEFRSSGITPVATDYIFHKRKFQNLN